MTVQVYNTETKEVIISVEIDAEGGVKGIVKDGYSIFVDSTEN